jgi:hypothetical protein
LRERQRVREPVSCAGGNQRATGCFHVLCRAW